MNDCCVSVLFATYNQESYVAMALESLLMQKTVFDYEIIVHDDASTDGTTEILKAYERKYPERIKLYLEKTNKFKQNINFWEEVVAWHSPAKYIAYCEGDDYWLSSQKLQKQYEALEEHPECDMCACGAMMVSEDGKLDVGEISPRQTNGILTIEETIRGGGMYLATNTLFYRKSMIESKMRFERIRSLDYATQMRGALRGGIYYIAEKMTAYRRYAKGSWTSTLAKSEIISKSHIECEKEILKTLDEETEGKYHEVISERLKAYCISFYDQLIKNKEIILKLVNDSSDSLILWGMGMRGNEFEKFCNDVNIRLIGVCDITNKNIGEITQYGNRVISTDEALEFGNTLLVSTTRAYLFLKEKGLKNRLVDLQVFMPLA